MDLPIFVGCSEKRNILGSLVPTVVKLNILIVLEINSHEIKKQTLEWTLNSGLCHTAGALARLHGCSG